jgi:hypothetical protein
MGISSTNQHLGLLNLPVYIWFNCLLEVQVNLHIHVSMVISDDEAKSGK